MARQIAVTPSTSRRFESLEDRRMLAGNVTANVFQGFLVICGDNLANVICVEGVNNQIKVSGTATTINSKSSPALFDTGSGQVCRGIVLDMKGGNDVVKIKNLEVPGWKLDVQLCGGHDVLTIDRVQVCGQVCINGDSGNDTVAITNSSFSGRVGIRTCDGVDAVVLTKVCITGALCINTDGGVDAVTLTDLQIKEAMHSVEALIADNAAGPDYSGFSKLDKDFVSKIRDCCCDVCCGLEINTGGDTDAVVLTKVCVDCFTSICTDGGVDVVTITNSNFGSKIFVAPAVESETVPAPVPEPGCCDHSSGLFIVTGSGNDVVTLVGVNVIGDLVIDTTGNVCCINHGKVERNDAAIALNSSKPSADGNDVVTLTKVCVQSACEFLPPTWAAADVAEFSPIECCACGSLTILTGNGVDVVTLAFVNTDCKALISTTDYCKLDGVDVVTITNSSFNKNGNIDQQMQLASESRGYRCVGLAIYTGAGNDVVTLVTVCVQGGTKICTDGGTDVVTINGLLADAIFVDLGSGNNDVLTLVNSKACWVCLDGGDGSGDVLVRANNDFNHIFWQGFETVV